MNVKSKYEKYKSISLPWMNQVPEHWEIMRTKHVLLEQKAIVGEDSTNYRLLSLTKQGIIYRDIENAKGKFPKEFNTYKIVEPDNIILCLFDIDETPRTVGISKYSGMITGAYDVFTTTNTNPNYLYYYFLSIDNIKGLRPLYTGLRKVVKMSVLLSYKIPIPPRPEQDQIVNFLDFKISKINKFIKDKKREIDLLNEQIEFLCYGEKEASKTITNWNSAFDPNWKSLKAKRLFDEINIKNCPEEELLAVTQDRGVVFKKDCNQNYVSPSGSLDGLKLVRKDDFVISLRSFQGGIEYSFCQGIVSPAYNVFCLNPRFENDELKIFFRFLFKTKPFIELLKSLGGGIRDGKNISFAEFSQFYMPIPPNEHLVKIKTISQKLDVLQKQRTKWFNLMNEYKESLISNVVTGQVDVRNVEIVEMIESESLDETDVQVETEEITEE